MSYTALYRRYRPQTFSAMIGQPQISLALAHAVSGDNLAHAYLFAGPRGTGKTSAARILARAINCQQPTPAGDPCNSCPACLRSLGGESLDVIEIDGASNRGIDEIRDLRERVKYAPAQEKRKIYIIDEVHMLTNDAFNALLKTLEEPPAHVVFIFATTAAHKLPLTVLSRCQRYDFRRIADSDIHTHLKAVAGDEGVALSEEAARSISRKADGGMRDALSLLDQCASVSDGQVDQSVVELVLGSVDQGFILQLLHDLLAKDVSSALALIEELVSSGRDLRQAVDDLLCCCRDLLLGLLSPSQSSDELPPWARDFSSNAYLGLLQSLADLDSRLRHALSPRISLELALIRACGLPEAGAEALPPKHPAPAREAVPKQAAKPAPPPAAKPTAKKPEAPAAAAKPAPNKKEAEPPPQAAPGAAAAPQAVDADLAKISEAWPYIITAVGQHNQGAAAMLRSVLPGELSKNKLILDFPPQLALMMPSFLSSSGYRPLVEQAISECVGAKLIIDARIGVERPLEGEEAEPAPESAAEAPAEQAVELNQASIF